MKESLKTFINRCRCCLESFEQDEKITPITEFFAIQYFAFTRLELETSDLLSNHVCEFCHSELLRFSVFKKDLIEKQVKLYNLLKQYHGHSNDEDYYKDTESDHTEEIFDEESQTAEQEDYDEIDQMGSISENEVYTEESSESENDNEENKIELETESESASDFEKDGTKGGEAFTQTSSKKKLVCKVCNHTFINQQGFSNHKKSHVSHPCGRWLCDICKFRTTSRSKLVTHKRVVHSEKVDFNIKPCDSPVKDVVNGIKQELNEDENAAARKRTGRLERYRCYCGYTFIKRKRLEEHIPKHGTLKQCNHGCDKVYSKIGQWLRHIRLNHPDFLSESLKMVTAAKSNTWYSVMRYNDNRHGFLKCQRNQKCTFYADNQEDLSNHYVVKHPETVSRKHECMICYKQFINEKTLGTHLNSYHNNLKQYVCNICNKRFQEYGQLADHKMNLHKNMLKPFACQKCNESFESKSALKQHEAEFHENMPVPKQKNYYCVCRKVFMYPSRLAEHQNYCKVYEEKTNDENTNNKHKCSQCRRAFALYKNLLHHQKTFGHN